MKHHNPQRTYKLFMLPALVYVFVLVIIPIVYNLNMSFRDITALNIRAERHEFVGLTKYIGIVGQSGFWGVMYNTFVFTFGSILFQFTIGFSIALYLNKTFTGRDFVRSAIILGWVLSPIVVGTIWRWMLNSDYGLLNYLLRWLGIIETNISWLPRPSTAMTGVVIANVWLGIPFNMMLLTGGLSNLPEEVYESATIDGANRLQKLFFLTIPLLKHTIAATLMLGFIYTLKVFDLIWVMTKGGPVNATTTMSVWSYRLSFVLFDFSSGAAAANILFALTMILAIVYIYYFGREET